MNLNRRIINTWSQRGSIVGSLLAFSIMGVSTVGLLHYMTGFKSTVVEQVEQRDNEILISRHVISRLKSLLVEKIIKANGSQATQNTYGICSLLEPPVDDVGAEAIYLNFKYVKSKSENWDKPRWSAIFAEPDWKLADASQCQRIDSKFRESIFSRCLEYTAEMQDAWRTFAIAQIHPELFPAGKAISLVDKALDPKLVMFILSAKVASFYLKTDSKKPSNSKPKDPQDVAYLHQTADMLWANSVGECHVQAQNGEWTSVQFSGVGMGSNFEKRVINDSRFSNSKHCNALEITDINPDTVQVGQLSNIAVSSIVPLNAKLSCTTNTFRCKPLEKTKKVPNFKAQDIDPLQFTFIVRNKHSKPLRLTSMNITFKKKNGPEIDGTDNRRLDDVSMPLYDNIDALYPIMLANTDPDEKNTYTITGDKEFTVNADVVSHCRSICTNNESYYPVIDADTAGDTDGSCFKRDFSDDPNSQVQCTVCYMKACHRTGLGTFGPLYEDKFPAAKLSTLSKKQTEQIIQGLPAEALDSQLPECYIQQAKDRGALLTKAQLDKLTGTGKCVAVQVSERQDFQNLHAKEYKLADCEKEKPVLCFVNGHYVPAVKINAKNMDQPFQIVKAKFKEAEEACFNMGREVGSTYSLARMLFEAYNISSTNEFNVNSIKVALNQVSQLKPIRADWGVDPASLTNQLNKASGTQSSKPLQNTDIFNFINNASRGMFLAPVDREYHFIPNGLIKQIIDKLVRDYTEMWTAIELDKGGVPVASIPWAGVAKNQAWALFFHKDRTSGSRPVLLKDKDGEKALGESSKHFALYYNIRWKGVAPIPAATEARFVCFDPNEKKYFVTEKTGELPEGTKICDEQGAYFIPPVSSEDWAKMMLQLNPNDKQYPFPNPIEDATDLDILSISLSNQNNSKLFLEQPIQDTAKAETKAWVALEKVPDAQTADSIQGPRASALNFYAKIWPDNRTILDKSIFKKDMDQLTKSGITLDAVPRDTCEDSKDKLLSLCELGAVPYEIVPHGSSCSNDSKPANLTSFKPNSHRYLAKLYQLLDKERDKFNSISCHGSSQSTCEAQAVCQWSTSGTTSVCKKLNNFKRVNVVVKGPLSPGCMERCRGHGKYYVDRTVKDPHTGLSKIVTEDYTYKASKKVKCPGPNPGTIMGKNLPDCTCNKGDRCTCHYEVEEAPLE